MALTFSPQRSPTIANHADQKSAKVRRVDFEGGYSQRSPLGPNSVARQTQFSWEVPQDQKEYIDGFFSARRGAEAFFYQSPWDSAPVLWTCVTWSCAPIGTQEGETVWRIQTLFKQEFDITP